MQDGDVVIIVNAMKGFFSHHNEQVLQGTKSTGIK